MFEITRKFWFVLILCSFHFSSATTFDFKKHELGGEGVQPVVGGVSRSDYSYGGSVQDGLELSVGAIIGIGIAVIVVFFAIPILLCFCCACCCFRNRRNKSTVVVAPQYVPQQYNNAAMHHQTVTVNNQTNGPTNMAYQNAYRENIGFSVYPGSGEYLHATQSTNQYYNSNNGIPPPPNPRFTINNQTHIYGQRPPPPYYNVAAPSAEQYQYQYQHQPERNEASKSTTTRTTNFY